jgi:virginiamycin B lyase
VRVFRKGITKGSKPGLITAAADGNLWFTQPDGNSIGRITPRGTVTEFRRGISRGAGPLGITDGPDGNVWFTELEGNRIGRIETGAAPPRRIPVAG